MKTGDLIGCPYKACPLLHFVQEINQGIVSLKRNKGFILAKATISMQAPRNLAPPLPLWERGPGGEG